MEIPPLRVIGWMFMLRFFVRLILSFCLFFTLMIVIMGLVGRLRPAMLLSTFMSNPDGTVCDRPCLFGIIPGQTTADQATQLLAEHPITRDGKWVTMSGKLLILPDKKTFVAFGETEDKLVDNILLTDTPFDSGLRIPDAIVDTSLLGEYILRFGKPVVGLPGSNYFVIEYPSMGIIAALARPFDYDEFVSPNERMSQIMLSDLKPCGRPFARDLHDWLGFIRMQSYFDDTHIVKVDYRNSLVSYPPPFLHCATQSDPNLP